MLMAVVMVLGAMPANAVMAEEDEIVMISEESESAAVEGADSVEAFSDYTEPAETDVPEYQEAAEAKISEPENTEAAEAEISDSENTEAAEAGVSEPDDAEPDEVEVDEPEYSEPAEDSEFYGDSAWDDTAGEVYR